MKTHRFEEKRYGVKETLPNNSNGLNSPVKDKDSLEDAEEVVPID